MPETITSPTPDNTTQQQNLSLLKIYTFYRVLLSIALIATFLLNSYQQPLVGELKPGLFIYSTCIYFLLNIITLVLVLPKRISFNSQQLIVNFSIDIIAIIFIVDASGGIASGVGILMVVVIAASSIILRGQLAMLIAALASLAVLADTASLISQNHLETSSLLPAGLLGIILFITSFFIQNLASRILGVQRIAEQRAVDVSKLQLLNREIVQSMRTGILVTDPVGKIYLANEAASELLANPLLQKAYKQSTPLFLNPELMKQFQHWQDYPQYHTPPFRATETGPELHASFSAISLTNSSNENSTDILIFLEDNRQLTQRAQQMKLASLGRLTASIAHEIRNPLGAISHAAQLLEESDALSDADQRLCNIIRNHSSRMNKVIENVLQLSSRSAPNPEKIVLVQWLQQFINEFGSMDNQQCDITLCSDGKEHQTTIDTSQLNQVVTNLVQNGLRYSQQQTGKATLSFDIHLNSITQLPVLDIIDDGAGISEDCRDNIFEPFYTTETKGSGLGLYISRELCEANEARLDYIRTDQGKSCFRISFPHPDRRLLQI
ncbi:MAG: ATP-binding protein [Pseudomonadales bacterium]